MRFSYRTHSRFQNNSEPDNLDSIRNSEYYKQARNSLATDSLRQTETKSASDHWWNESNQQKRIESFQDKTSKAPHHGQQQLVSTGPSECDAQWHEYASTSSTTRSSELPLHKGTPSFRKHAPSSGARNEGSIHFRSNALRRPVLSFRRRSTDMLTDDDQYRRQSGGSREFSEPEGTNSPRQYKTLEYTKESDKQLFGGESRRMQSCGHFERRTSSAIRAPSSFLGKKELSSTSSGMPKYKFTGRRKSTPSISHYQSPYSQHFQNNVEAESSTSVSRTPRERQSRDSERMTYDDEAKDKSDVSDDSQDEEQAIRRLSVSEESNQRQSIPTTTRVSSLCCDKCDGPHETANCKWFKKNRDNHPDAKSRKHKFLGDTGNQAPKLVAMSKARVVKQPGDGSCLFHSLAYGLGKRGTAFRLRADIARYISSNPKLKIADTALEEWIKYDSNSTVSSYTNRMSKSGWGGGIECAACSHLMKVNVHVYEIDRKARCYKRISCFDFSKEASTINVLYQGRMHYDALVL